MKTELYKPIRDLICMVILATTVMVFICLAGAAPALSDVARY